MSSVDVIIPCYKYGHLLRECVTSVLGQPGVDLRVLILDDASPDDTPAVGTALAEGDVRVEYRRHGSNHGHIATYNEGLDWASADYVLLLSADDLLTPCALRRAVGFLDLHPEVGLAYGRHIDFRTGQTLPEVAPVPECGGQDLSYKEFLATACDLGHTPIESPAAIVRNRVHRAVGGYRPEFPHSGDTELWLRLAAVAPVGVLDADQAYRRWHDGNMTYRHEPIGRLRQQLAAFEAHFHDHAGRLADFGPYRRRLARAVGESSFWTAYHMFERGDAAACTDMLRYACDVDPGIRSRPEWSRLRWKRLMGPVVWGTLRPLVDHLSRAASSLRSGRAARCRTPDLIAVGTAAGGIRR
jgi:glycosyltransferase involved in cell wall biosynthesis